MTNKERVAKQKELTLSDLKSLMQELQERIDTAESADFGNDWSKLGDLSHLRTGLREALGYDD